MSRSIRLLFYIGILFIALLTIGGAFLLGYILRGKDWWFSVQVLLMYSWWVMEPIREFTSNIIRKIKE